MIYNMMLKRKNLGEVFTELHRRGSMLKFIH